MKHRLIKYNDLIHRQIAEKKTILLNKLFHMKISNRFNIVEMNVSDF